MGRHHPAYYILKKYKTGNVIEDIGDYEILKRYASTGCVSLGFDLERKRGTASLTHTGRSFLRQL